MKLTQEVIDDIRSSADIAQVIGHYIPLVKKGKGYTALCPFHDDHDPSLSISEDKQIYKCFVCGNGGSAADCEHIVGELMKGFLKKRPLLKNTPFQTIKSPKTHVLGNVLGSLPSFFGVCARKV